MYKASDASRSHEKLMFFNAFKSNDVTMRKKKKKEEEGKGQRF